MNRTKRDSANLDALKVKFTHSNTMRVKDKRPYTIYEIEVRSASTITWVIYKRYNDFYTLHQELSKFQAASASPAKLPTLPPKRLTRSLAVEFVEKRKVELQEYLREILVTPSLRHSDIILAFLEVPDSVRPMLSRSADSDSKRNGADAAASALPGYQHNSAEEKRVLELIRLLSNNKNKVAAIKSFEEDFFEWRPRLSKEFVRLLFQGKSRPKDGEVSRGLIQTCGDFAYSRVASRAALDLLCRLLDVEKNKEAQLYLDTMTSLDSHVLQQLQLHQHVLSERGNRLGAFRLLEALKNKMPELPVERLVSDTYARQEYLKWAERKNQSVSSSSSEPQENVVKSLSLQDVGFRKIAEQSFADVLNVAHSEQGWKVVKYDDAGLADEIDSKQEKMLDTYENIRVAYKTDPRRDMVVMRLSVPLPFSVDDVTTLLIDITRRKEWDLKFHRGQRVAKLDATADVVQAVFKSFSSPYKYRDFCVLRAWKKMVGGGRMLVMRSVLHENAQEQKDHVRAVLFPSGYIVEPMEVDDGSKQSCLLTYVAQLDREAVLIYSPDLLGESEQLCQSIRLFEALLLQEAQSKQGQPPNQQQQQDAN